MQYLFLQTSNIRPKLLFLKMKFSRTKKMTVQKHQILRGDYFEKKQDCN